MRDLNKEFKNLEVFGYKVKLSTDVNGNKITAVKHYTDKSFKNIQDLSGDMFINLNNNKKTFQFLGSDLYDYNDDIKTFAKIIVLRHIIYNIKNNKKLLKNYESFLPFLKDYKITDNFYNERLKKSNRKRITKNLINKLINKK